MKEDLLGPNHWLSFSATCHTVRPRSSALSFGHLRIAPPKSSSDMPKCFRYHAASAALSPLLLKKTPPTPVTFAIVGLLPVGLSPLAYLRAPLGAEPAIQESENNPVVLVYARCGVGFTISENDVADAVLPF